LQDDEEALPRGRLTSRSIRSFVVRNGRTTSAQADALTRLLPHFGISYRNRATDPAPLFGRQAPTWLEIGFGNGDVLLDMAGRHPDVNVLGAEVHESGIGHALIGIEARELTNVRLIQHDAVEILQNMLPPASLARVLLLFPDPWHKKRHHKRRIVQQEFIDALARTLAPEGVLHCATDWLEYGEWMMERLDGDPRFSNMAGTGQASPRPAWRPVTRFERRGQRLGHTVTDLLYRRC
jgi:tRNA (guanine-N7-)-methyltransferase